VNDASTDATREIVERHARDHDFIRPVNVERAPGRHFGNKVSAFNRGLEEMRGLPYDFIGNLDADISFAPGYFASILAELEKDEALGIAGGMVHSLLDDEFVSQAVALDSVAGAVQLFRRTCFEQVGGYMPLPLGGIDTAAEVNARMHGWGVRTFPEHRVFEHRRTGSATARPLRARVKEGRRMQSLGFGLLFFLARSVYRALESPVLIGSAAAVFGFVSSRLRGDPVVLSPEATRFLRAEQLGKLRRMVGLR
jgi:glycosyltransferase involved in cell wall biosynthesis